MTALAEELAAADIEDVLKPDVFTVDDTGSSAWLEECTGLSDKMTGGSLSSGKDSGMKV